jgi:hypothetical protein
VAKHSMRCELCNEIFQEPFADSKSASLIKFTCRESGSFISYHEEERDVIFESDPGDLCFISICNEANSLLECQKSHYLLSCNAKSHTYRSG